MKVDLSPGDWAGVMAIVAARADTLRDHAVSETNEDERADLHETADDLHRIARKIRDALAENGERNRT